MEAPVEALQRLERLTNRLQHLGWMSALFAGWSLAIVVLSPLFISLRFNFHGDLLFLLFLFFATSVVSAAGGIATLTVFERRRQEGLMMYEELSDEVEWEHRTYRSPAYPPSESVAARRPHERPDFGVRIVFRRFLLAATLPLAPDRGGPILYFGVYVGSLAWQAFFLARLL